MGARIKPPTKELVEHQLKIPKMLIERAIKMNAVYHLTLQQMLRDGLDMKLTELEKKIEDREEKERQRELDKKRVLIGQHLLGARPVGNIPNLGQMTQPITTPFAERVPFGQRRQAEDRDQSLLITLAQSILDADQDRELMSQRVRDAVTSYKKEHPLTHPDDQTILGLIEEHVVALRRQGATATRTVDSFVGSILDVSKVRTAGAAPVDDEESDDEDAQ